MGKSPVDPEKILTPSRLLPVGKKKRSHTQSRLIPMSKMTSLVGQVSIPPTSILSFVLIIALLFQKKGPNALPELILVSGTSLEFGGFETAV
jgi:hypothetical protein